MVHSLLSCPELGLSVERANPAASLYLSDGWQVVESGRDSDAMVLKLAS